MDRLKTASVHCLAVSLLALTMGAACAQSAASYPNKPVRVIIPFAPGTSLTTIMTALADRVAKEMGQNFLADYRPGGDTAVGVGAAARSAPDGYTLLQATSSYVVNNWLNPDLPYDAMKDLTPAAMLGKTGFVLVANPAAPNTLKEFIAYAKANPGRLNMSYAASGGLLNFYMLMNAAGIEFVPVSYAGAPQAVSSVLSGDTTGTLTTAGNVTSLVSAGKLKALAVTGDKRSRSFPNAPTFVEAGVKDFNPTNWFVLLAPARTPKDILEKLNAQFRKAQQAPEAIDMLEKVNIDMFSASVDEAERFVRSESAVYGKAVKDSGMANKK